MWRCSKRWWARMISIGVVARQTGIEVGTLRKWELRHGFPQPLRHESGQRYYCDSDIEKLLLIARRISTGERVGKVIRELNGEPLPAPGKWAEAAPPDLAIGQVLAALLGSNVSAFRQALEEARAARSLFEFVEEVAAPLTVSIGECWALGQLPIHGEHLFSSMLQDILQREAALCGGINMAPRVLLTSPAGELHTLGLSMVNAVLAEAGIASVRLPGGLPLPEIIAACAAYQIKVLGISASIHYPPRLLRAFILELHAALPAGVTLWLGGAAMTKVAAPPAGVTVILSMRELQNACSALNLNGERALPTEKV